MGLDARSWPVVESIDPSDTRGLHVAWFAIDPASFAICVHAKLIPHGAFSEMARGIQLERGYLPNPPVLGIMDSRGGRHTINLEAREDWFGGFARNGLHYVPSVEADLARVHEWLRPLYHPLLDKVVPRLRFTERVADMERGPAWALESFTWDRSQSEYAQRHQKPKDWIDVIRYFCGYPGMTWERFMGDGLEVPEGILAQSYAPRPGVPARSEMSQQIPESQSLEMAPWEDMFMQEEERDSVTMYERRLRRATRIHSSSVST